MQAIVDSTPPCPPNCRKLEDLDIEAFDRQFGLPVIHPGNTSSPQRKDMFDNAGNHTGYMTNDGSSGIWSIYDAAGNYQGRVNDGVIYNNRGDYIGQIK
jgi:hypothetical protein